MQCIVPYKDACCNASIRGVRSNAYFILKDGEFAFVARCVFRSYKRPQHNLTFECWQRPTNSGIVFVGCIDADIADLRHASSLHFYFGIEILRGVLRPLSLVLCPWYRSGNGCLLMENPSRVVSIHQNCSFGRMRADMSNVKKSAVVLDHVRGGRTDGEKMVFARRSRGSSSAFEHRNRKKSYASPSQSVGSIAALLLGTSTYDAYL
jgi:hypothetical protein